MSLATLNRGAAPSLGDLVDGLAARTGAWVVVERFGSVVTHGTGTSSCPTSLATSVMTKSTTALRGAVTWNRGGRHLTGKLEGTTLLAADLGDGVTAWFVGAAVDEASISMLAGAAHADAQPVVDPVVRELLHPVGPARRGSAPAAQLVVLRHEGPLGALARAAAVAVAGTTARVHTEDEFVLVALLDSDDPRSLVCQVKSSCPAVRAGVISVSAEASDWVSAAALADASARVAADLGLALASPSDPLVAAELVVAEAQAAVADLVRELPDAPLRLLQDHDARSSGELVSSLTAWCRAGFDVPSAAAALHVHANTLRYRLKRAGEVSGLDVTRPRQLLALQLLLGV
jgi:hypothetical protein